MIERHVQPAGLGRNLTFGLLDVIGRAVVVGDYERRNFPTETELAAQYGVSKSVTREALKMLAAKGLVGARPKQGTFVHPPDHWNLLDSDVLRWLHDGRISPELIDRLRELRVGVEPQAASLAARRATPEALADIAVAVERMRAADEGCDDMLDAEIAFHTAILRASHNPFHSQFQGLVTAAISASARLASRSGQPVSSAPASADVLAAIVAGDIDAAFTAMRIALNPAGGWIAVRQPGMRLQFIA